MYINHDLMMTVTYCTARNIGRMCIGMDKTVKNVI